MNYLIDRNTRTIGVGILVAGLTLGGLGVVYTTLDNYSSGREIFQNAFWGLYCGGSWGLFLAGILLPRVLANRLQKSQQIETLMHYRSEQQLGPRVRVTESAKRYGFGFWHGQFAPRITRRQIAFDVVFGVIAPLVAFQLDPLALSGRLPVLNPLWVHVAAVFGAAMLILWIMLHTHLKQWNALVAGLLMASAVWALFLGLALLPLSLLGLVFSVSALGFILLVMAYVFFRDAMKALNLAREYTRRNWQAWLSGLGFGIVLPLLAESIQRVAA
jgi:hypothetical protein